LNQANVGMDSAYRHNTVSIRGELIQNPSRGSKVRKQTRYVTWTIGQTRPKHMHFI